MQVNANTKVQTTNPLESLLGDKTDKSAAQTAQEAFATVLAKSGVKVQGMVGGSYQAPAALAPVLDKPIKADPKDNQPQQTREPQGKAVARGHDDDKTTGQDRASEVRSDKAAGAKDDSKGADNQAASSDDSQAPKQADNQAKASDDKAPAAQQADQGQPEKTTAQNEGKQAVVAKIEETVTAAVVVAAAQPVQQAQVQAKTEQGPVQQAQVTEVKQVGEVKQDNGPKASPQAVAAVAQVVQAQTEKVQTVLQQGPQQKEEAAPEVVANLGQAVKAAVAQVKDDTHGQNQAAPTVDPKRDEQAAQLAKIIGDQGQVKIEVGPKAAPLSQPSSTLTANLVGVETQMQQAVQNPDAGFGANNGPGNGQMQNNPGQPAVPQIQITQPNGAQMGAGVAALAQAQGNSFQASLAAGVQAVASGEGAQEIQGVQAPSGAQASAAPQNAQPALGQAQAAQDLRQAVASQASGKASEVKLPIPAKEIVDQVNVQISKAAKDGLDKITVQMRPEALGRVEVHLKLGQDSQVSAHIVADRPETLDALKKDSSQLEKSLADAGFKTDSNSLSFSLRGEQQNNQQQAANDQRGSSFFDRARALDEADAAETIVAARRMSTSSRSGVDISV